MSDMMPRAADPEDVDLSAGDAEALFNEETAKAPAARASTRRAVRRELAIRFLQSRVARERLAARVIQAQLLDLVSQDVENAQMAAEYDMMWLSAKVNPEKILL